MRANRCHAGNPDAVVLTLWTWLAPLAGSWGENFPDLCIGFGKAFLAVRLGFGCDLW